MHYADHLCALFGLMICCLLMVLFFMFDVQHTLLIWLYKMILVRLKMWFLSLGGSSSMWRARLKELKCFVVFVDKLEHQICWLCQIVLHGGTPHTTCLIQCLFSGTKNPTFNIYFNHFVIFMCCWNNGLLVKCHFFQVWCLQNSQCCIYSWSLM